MNTYSLRENINAIENIDLQPWYFIYREQKYKWKEQVMFIQRISGHGPQQSASSRCPCQRNSVMTNMMLVSDSCATQEAILHFIVFLPMKTSLSDTVCLVEVVVELMSEQPQ